MSNTAKTYILIYFRGCPSFDIAKDLLRGVGIEFNEVCQDDLPDCHELKRYTSPTLLEDVEIVFGARLSAGSSACTASIPSKYQLFNAINRDRSADDTN